MPDSRSLGCLVLGAGVAVVVLTAAGCSGGSSKPTAAASTSAPPSSFTVNVPNDLGNNASKDTLAKYIGFDQAKAAKALRYLRGLFWVRSATYIESKGEIDVVYKKGATLDEVNKTANTINRM